MLLVILVVVIAILLLGGLGFIVGTRSRQRRVSGSSDTVTAEIASRQPDSLPGSGQLADTVPSESSVATLPVPEQRGVATKESLGRHDLYGGMGKSRGLISGYLKSLRSRAALNDSIWDEMEEALLGSDVGLKTSDAVLRSLREKVKAGLIKDTASILPELKAEILSYFSANDGYASSGDRPAGNAISNDSATDGHPSPANNVTTDGQLSPANNSTTSTTIDSTTDGHPSPANNVAERVSSGRSLRFNEGVTNVWLFVGVNGVGKTTTIGKVAMSQVAAGRSVILAAGDTFRAAAGEQLEIWGERADAEVVRGKEGGDPGAVVFDAVERAKAKGYDLVLADTAGRLHTNVNLVEELKKIYRVATKSAEAVSEVLLVLDATTGQNGLVQAKQFTDAVGVTGIVLTKLDGTARGGIVVAIERELGIPVKMVGIGEGVDDLIPFDPSEFVEALFG
ncbi:MAG: signal recognition particle-docking protein FtsY [Actinobacteria bacterium]|nr:signal recognition particle-docking protein FtsY [Actinomycetota bacterium]